MSECRYCMQGVLPECVRCGDEDCWCGHNETQCVRCGGHGFYPLRRTQGEAIALYHARMEHRVNVVVRRSYEALATELMHQWELLQDRLDNVCFTFRDPYRKSAELFADLDNGRLWVLATDQRSLPADHPLLWVAPGVTIGNYQMCMNDIFRAVHDYFGHYGDGESAPKYSWGRIGEDMAYQRHKLMFPSVAHMALCCETRGQNSWVNCHPDHANLPASDRPFSPQKCYQVSQAIIDA